MRVLWVKVGGLWPLNIGGRQRTFHMLSELARRHQVTLVTTHGPTDDPSKLEQALAHCERVVSVPFQAPKVGTAAFARTMGRSWLSPLPVDLWKWRGRDVIKTVRGLAASTKPDVIVADFLVGVQNVPPDVGPVVHFSHNVEYQIWRRLHDVERRRWKKMLLALEWRKMRRAERKACRSAALTVAVSADDRDRLAAEAPGATIVDVPTGVDVEYFRPAGVAEVPDRLVFSGAMDWYPNEDAILHFMEATLPLVRKARPGVTLTVIGRNPSERLRKAAAESRVTVTGTVDDVRPHIAEGELYIVPLRVGGGTRLKIFEALAMGKAVLSTTVGAEGLAVENGRHLVLADGEERFADAIVQLLADAGRRRGLAAEGRRLVEERFSWKQVTRVFEGYLEQARQTQGVA
jgi:glycosyltransferase involved in cell wall biosynthesis